MNNLNKSTIKSLFMIFVLEFIVALNINFFAYNTIIRIIGLLLMLAGIGLYFKDIKKLTKTSLIFLVISLLYGISVLPNMILHFTSSNIINILDIIPVVISFFVVAVIGYLIGIDEKNDVGKILITIFASLFVFGIVSLFSTLFAYKFLYALKENIGSVKLSSKMWIIGINPFLKESRVYMAFFGYELSLLSSGFMVLWTHKNVDENEMKLKKVALASGVLGIVGLLIIPYILGIAVTVFSILITMLIINFPKDKKKRMYIYVGIGLVLGLVLLVVVLKGQDIARVKVGLNVIKNVFKYPLGGQPEEILNETSNTRNIYLDALYQNGIPAFLVLLGMTIIAISVIYKYYKNSNQSSLKKNLILSYIVHYFVYVNLNYGQNVFIEYDDSLPLYLDPTMLIVLLLIGYMAAVNARTSNERSFDEAI